MLEASSSRLLLNLVKYFIFVKFFDIEGPADSSQRRRLYVILHLFGFVNSTAAKTASIYIQRDVAELRLVCSQAARVYSRHTDAPIFILLSLTRLCIECRPGSSLVRLDFCIESCGVCGQGSGRTTWLRIVAASLLHHARRVCIESCGVCGQGSGRTSWLRIVAASLLHHARRVLVQAERSPALLAHGAPTAARESIRFCCSGKLPGCANAVIFGATTCGGGPGQLLAVAPGLHEPPTAAPAGSPTAPATITWRGTTTAVLVAS